MDRNSECARRIASVIRKETDLARWSDARNLDPSWGLRSRLVSNYIASSSHLLDLGCGSSLIEKYLDISCKYLPADIILRNDRTVFCNLNESIFPSQIHDVDTILMLGVLEYVFDFPLLFSKLATYKKKIIFSYCDVDTSKLRSFQARAAFGWVNSYTCAEIENFILRANSVSLFSFEIDNLQRGYIAQF